MLPCVSVNGPLYVFDRETCKLNWRQDVGYQMLITDQLDDMPLLAFASYQTKWQPAAAGRGQMLNEQWTAIQALDKRDGKEIYNAEQARSSVRLHTVKIDLRTGQVDLLGNGYCLTFTINNESPTSRPTP
jgi:hypothetical protein